MQFQLIKGGETHSIDAERIVPGRVVAEMKNRDFTSTLFRIGDCYYERAQYHNLTHLVEKFRERHSQLTSINRGEWAHLQDLAGQGDEQKEPESKTEGPARPMSAAEARRFFGPHAKGGRLIAYNSFSFESRYSASGVVWQHNALFSTGRRAPSGKQVFLYFELTTSRQSHDCRTVTQVAEVRSKYRRMAKHLEPLRLRRSEQR